jgi:hypothetical protein
MAAQGNVGMVRPPAGGLAPVPPGRASPRILMPPLVTTVTVGMSIAAVIALAFATGTGADPAGIDPTTLRCTNPFSGATWDVAIDPARRTAGSFPADITGKSIEWHDSVRGGRYEFDRTSGDLTVAYASSTGGFFVKDQCREVRRAQ